MFKRGQITIFIILGIAIIIVLGFVFILNQKSPVQDIPQQSAKLSLDEASIKDYVNACLKTVGEKGIRLIGLQGGYLNVKGDSVYNEVGDGLPTEIHYFFGANALPYLWFEKKSLLPHIDKIKTKLSNYVVVEMQNCLNLSQFEKQNYKIKKPNIKQIESADENSISVDYSNAKIKADINLNDEGTIIVLKYPLIFENNNQRIETFDFSAGIPLRLSVVYNVADKLLKNNLAEKYEVNKHCASFASKDKLVNIYVRTNLYDYNYVVQIVDEKPLLTKKEMPFKFQFATRNAKLEGDCVG